MTKVKTQPPGALVHAHRPPREVDHRGEEERQVVEPHHPERGRDHQDPQRVEDHQRADQEPQRERRAPQARRPAEVVERPAQDPQGGEDVDPLPRLEPGGRDEELGVRRLEEDEVERPLADLVHHHGERGVDRPVQHPAQEGEVADDHHGAVEGPPRHRRAVVEGDVQRDDPQRRPRHRHEAVDHEVPPVLQAEGQREPELEREQAEVAHRQGGGGARRQPRRSRRVKVRGVWGALGPPIVTGDDCAPDPGGACSRTGAMLAPESQ